MRLTILFREELEGFRFHWKTAGVSATQLSFHHLGASAKKSLDTCLLVSSGKVGQVKLCKMWGLIYFWFCRQASDRKHLKKFVREFFQLEELDGMQGQWSIHV